LKNTRRGTNEDKDKSDWKKQSRQTKYRKVWRDAVKSLAWVGTSEVGGEDLLELCQNLLLILHDRVQSGLILQNGRLVFLDRFLICFDCALVRQNRFLILQNMLLVCDYVILRHSRISSFLKYSFVRWERSCNMRGALPFSIPALITSIVFLWHDKREGRRWSLASGRGVSMNILLMVQGPSGSIPHRGRARLLIPA